MSGNGSILSKLLVWTVAGVLALVALKLALALFGFVVGIGAFLLFTVGPLILIGWLALKAWEYLRGREHEAY
jgi:hypothetical protein